MSTCVDLFIHCMLCGSEWKREARVTPEEVKKEKSKEAKKFIFEEKEIKEVKRNNYVYYDVL